MAEKKKQAKGRKPFEFGDKEKKQVVSVVESWQKALADRKEQSLPTDVLVCALGNFLARMTGNIAYVNGHRGEEYYYLTSIEDFALNTLRQAGIDIDKQIAAAKAKAQEAQQKATAVKVGEA